jgi:hypothetical protein
MFIPYSLDVKCCDCGKERTHETPRASHRPESDDFANDMARLAADPKTREWWTLTEPLQEPCASREPGEW